MRRELVDLILDEFCLTDRDVFVRFEGVELLGYFSGNTGRLKHKGDSDEFYLAVPTSNFTFIASEVRHILIHGDGNPPKIYLKDRRRNR